MAKLVNQTKDNPRLEQRVLKDGRVALELVYYFGREEMPIFDEYGEPVFYESGAMKGKPKYKIVHNRKKETLPFYLTAKPRTPIEREQNRQILTMAQKIRFEKEQEMKERESGMRLKKSKEVNFYDYFENYLNEYTKKDVRIVKMAFRSFKDFVNATPEYKGFANKIKPEQITPDMVKDFTEYLQANHNGGGAKAVYARFKKVINYAIEHDILAKNPCKRISITIDENRLVKDVLSSDEMQKLISTNIEGLNQNVRRAFILSLYCGIRWCDVKDLTFANVDYSNKLLKFEQNKTKGHSASSGVIIPLNDSLLRLIGEPSNVDGNDSNIFDLPSHTMCLKSLKRWVKCAGINKHITWHCARHSFAVNILNNGANIKTVASLLGHSGLQHTEKYTRAVDSLKEAAINSLPELNF